jgi:hypothetical protein
MPNARLYPFLFVGSQDQHGDVSHAKYPFGDRPEQNAANATSAMRGHDDQFCTEFLGDSHNDLGRGPNSHRVASAQDSMRGECLDQGFFCHVSPQAVRLALPQEIFPHPMQRANRVDYMDSRGSSSQSQRYVDCRVCVEGQVHRNYNTILRWPIHHSLRVDGIQESRHV